MKRFLFFLPFLFAFSFGVSPEEVILDGNASFTIVSPEAQSFWIDCPAQIFAEPSNGSVHGVQTIHLQGQAIGEQEVKVYVGNPQVSGMVTVLVRQPRSWKPLVMMGAVLMVIAFLVYVLVKW
ncbi:hypothetical protein GF342_01495 [Candidatus Woesearchaeota archaeon]|nr:hypothetical protein [Candidatus Woesearchaeota archaeon]